MDFIIQTTLFTGAMIALLMIGCAFVGAFALLWEAGLTLIEWMEKRADERKYRKLENRRNARW